MIVRVEAKSLGKLLERLRHLEEQVDHLQKRGTELVEEVRAERAKMRRLEEKLERDASPGWHLKF